MTKYAFFYYRHLCYNSSPFIHQVENENPNTAVYANVTDLKKIGARSPISSVSTCSSPGLVLSPDPDFVTPPNSAEWQVHTDQDSGKDFFYHPTSGQSSWSDPRSPLPGSAMESLTFPLPTVSTPSSTDSVGSDWQQVWDEATGRHYYYNHTLNQTTWSAPDLLSPPPSTDESNVPVRSFIWILLVCSSKLL